MCQFINGAAKAIMMILCLCMGKLNAADFVDTEVPPEYIKYVREIRSEFSKEMEREYSLKLIAEGGSMPYKVCSIAMRFECEKKVNIDEARWLLITLQRKLMDKVNKHEKIRPFLDKYPFPVAGADVQLSFQEVPDKNAKNPEFVYSARNKIFYCKDNEEKGAYDRIFVEPYEEALKRYKLSEKPLVFKDVI